MGVIGDPAAARGMTGYLEKALSFMGGVGFIEAIFGVTLGGCKADGYSERAINFLNGFGIAGLPEIEGEVVCARGAKAPAAELYEIGRYSELRRRMPAGSGFQVHHIPQIQLIKDFLFGYKKSRGISIVLTANQHRALSTASKLTGSYATKSLSEIQSLLSLQVNDLIKVGVPMEKIRILEYRLAQEYPTLYIIGAR